MNPEDYFIIRDADTIYCSPSYGELIYFHVSQHPEIKCFTATTNRIGCDFQKDSRAPKGNDYQLHREYGIKKQKEQFRKLTDVTNMGTMSGFWMCIKKELWDKIEKPKTLTILGVDNHIHRQIRGLGEKIYLIQGLYLFHWYAGFDGEGHRNISHLK